MSILRIGSIFLIAANAMNYNGNNYLRGGGDISSETAMAESFGEMDYQSVSRRLQAGIPTEVQYIIIVILILCSAMFSGLTLGFLGLDKIGLEIVMNGDDPILAAKAAKIAPIRKDGNLLLCTLLLGNVSVNAGLSILMAALTSGLLGFITSTVVIVIFGEIIPQASCSRYALQVGAFFVPVIRVLIVLMYPLTKPLSLMLDLVLGDEIGTIHSRKELTELLKIHVKHGAMDAEAGNVAQGAIKYQDMFVKDVMTKAEDFYMLSANDRLNFKKITEIFKAGYSRVPVFDKNENDVVGLLLVKDLIFADPEDEMPVRNFIQIFGRSFLQVWPDQRLGDTLRLFKAGDSHMALVKDVFNEDGPGDPYYVVAGIVTLEDILEEILGDEILDETDGIEGIAGVTNPREFDYDRLRLLDSGKLEYEQLTSVEASAIGSHLRANVKDLGPLSEQDTERLLTGCPVLDIERKGHALLPSAHGRDAALIPSEDMLYRRGEATETMLLVLTGKLIVLAGKDRFRSEVGPWSVIGADAVTTADGDKYEPDFSAFIGTSTLRCIRITRDQFRLATVQQQWVWNHEAVRKGGMLASESHVHLAAPGIESAVVSDSAAVAATAAATTVATGTAAVGTALATTTGHSNTAGGGVPAALGSSYAGSAANLKDMKMQEKRLHRAQQRRQRQNQQYEKGDEDELQHQQQQHKQQQQQQQLLGNRLASDLQTVGSEDAKESESRRGSGTSELSILVDKDDIVVAEKASATTTTQYSSVPRAPSNESEPAAAEQDEGDQK